VPSIRNVGRAVAIGGLVAVAAGCAGVPQSGSVHVGRLLPAGGGSQVINTLRQIPSAPPSGSPPTRIVTGFLSSLVDSDGNYAVARLYLAPHAVWHTDAATTVYDQAVVHRTGVGTVSVSLRRVGTVDSRGNYVVAPAELHEGFTLVRADGQWRISHLPAGILLSTSDAQRTLQTATIYFFNQARTRLVPEPVLVAPNEPGIATTLVHELVDGPNRALAPAVTTAVPNGTDLVGNVPVDGNGVASVDLQGSVAQILPVQLEQLSAQIVWTLRQLQGVKAIRLLVNGAPLSVAGVAAVQPIGSWPQFDPEAPPTTSGALVSDHGLVISIGAGATVPSAFTVGHYSSPAISADGTTVAALRHVGHQTTLLVGPANGALRSRVTAASISAPSFDPQGDVVVVSGVGANARIVEVPRTGSVHSIAEPRSVKGDGVSQVAISRDGSRIAMVVGPPNRQGLIVGSVTTVDGGLEIAATNVVIPGTSDVRGVAWGGANEIVTTVRSAGHRRSVIETGVDGYQPHRSTRSGLPSDPTAVAAAPGQPMLAVADGAVWMLSGARWGRVSSGIDPSYAG
jgi:hypothetical protein